MNTTDLQRYATAHAAVRVLYPVLDDEDGDGAYPAISRDLRERYEEIYQRALSQAVDATKGGMRIDGEPAGATTLAHARLLAWRMGGNGHAITWRGGVVVSPGWQEPTDAATITARKNLAALRRALGV